MERKLTSERIVLGSATYEKVKRLYESAFPADERAPLDSLIEGREWQGDNRAYFVEHELSAEELPATEPCFAGFAFNYVDDRFCYLFYLAVEQELRNTGIGSAILRDMLAAYPDRSLILEMEELNPEAENYEERLNRSRFYQGNGLKLTTVHNSQFGVPYHVLCTDPSITLADYRRMWHNIVRLQGYSEDDGRRWLNQIFGDSLG